MRRPKVLTSVSRVSCVVSGVVLCALVRPKTNLCLRTTDGPDQTEAELLYEIGETARSGGDMLEAEEHLHKALEASHKLADPLVRSHSVHSIHPER